MIKYKLVVVMTNGNVYAKHLEGYDMAEIVKKGNDYAESFPGARAEGSKRLLDLEERLVGHLDDRVDGGIDWSDDAVFTRRDAAPIDGPIWQGRLNIDGAMCVVVSRREYEALKEHDPLPANERGPVINDKTALRLLTRAAWSGENEKDAAYWLAKLSK